MQSHTLTDHPRSVHHDLAASLDARRRLDLAPSSRSRIAQGGGPGRSPRQTPGLEGRTRLEIHNCHGNLHVPAMHIPVVPETARRKVEVSLHYPAGVARHHDQPRPPSNYSSKPPAVPRCCVIDRFHPCGLGKASTPASRHRPILVHVHLRTDANTHEMHTHMRPHTARTPPPPTQSMHVPCARLCRTLPEGGWMQMEMK